MAKESRPKPFVVAEGGEVVEVDADQFQISASDSKGHSDRVYCRVQPQVKDQISHITGGKVFPYRTAGDLVRHALHRHLKWLEGMGTVRSVMGQVEIINELMRHESYKTSLGESLQLMTSQVSTLFGLGEEGEARRVLLLVLNHISQMPDGVWRRKYAKEVNDKWGAILSNGTRARLASFAAEEDEDGDGNGNGESEKVAL